MKTMTSSAMPVGFEGNGVELRTRASDGMTFGWVRLAKGVNLAPATLQLTEDLCPCPHWGYMIKGKVRMRANDGDRDYEAGQAFYWAPGHAPEAVEDSEYVDVSPTGEFERAIAHIFTGTLKL